MTSAAATVASATAAPPSERELLAAILGELQLLNANITRLEEDLRPALPFKFRPGRRG